jgi:hypothetical protein
LPGDSSLVFVDCFFECMGCRVSTGRWIPRQKRRCSVRSGLHRERHCVRPVGDLKMLARIDAEPIDRGELAADGAPGQDGEGAADGRDEIVNQLYIERPVKASQGLAS